MKRFNSHSNFIWIVLTLLVFFSVFISISIIILLVFKSHISVFLLIGFAGIVFTYLLFIKLETNNKISFNIRLKFLSEDLFKIIILILICILIVIPPIFESESIILWEKVSFFNLLRAIILLVGSLYLPGSFLYTCIFYKYNLNEFFKVKPIFLKITLIPLLSLSIIGIIVLFFDQIGFNRGLITIMLFILIVIFGITDLILNSGQKRIKTISEIKLKFDFYTLIILILSICVIFISIGYQTAWKYLISGDPWDGIKSAKFIGSSDNDSFSYTYPNFWGNIIFGLSTLAGLPFINTNTLLVPLSFIFITSLYLFFKAILKNHKEKYIVLSTLIFTIFSGFLLDPAVKSIIYECEFYFIYKSYSYFLFFLGIALFIFLSNLNNSSIKDRKIFYKSIKFRITFLIALLFLLSFMTYMIPLLFGIIFMFVYCIFSNKTKFKNFLNFFIYFVILFVLFDLCLNFFLSYLIINWILNFFNFSIIWRPINNITYYLLLYFLFSITVFILAIINRFSFKNKFTNIKNFLRNRLNLKKLFRLILFIFSIFLVIEVVITFMEYFSIKSYISDYNFFYLYLDYIFLNLGLIGILGIYFAYYFIKIDKKLFLILSIWVILSLLIASLLIWLEGLYYLPLSPQNIPERSYDLMIHWFNRTWYYSMPALSIFTSIGFFKLIKRIKRTKVYRKFPSLKYLYYDCFFLILIIFSFSGVMITGYRDGNAGFRYTDSQVETLGWISENIPMRTGILVGDNFFMGIGTKTITYVRQYFFYDIFEAEFNETKCIEQICFLKNNTIQYAVISQFFISFFLNKSDFVNNILVPDFYNVTLYINGDLTVYYAPYFD